MGYETASGIKQALLLAVLWVKGSKSIGEAEEIWAAAGFSFEQGKECRRLTED
jgi:hypothetical protein